MLPKTASGIIPAASTIPTAMDQKRKAMSRGSLIAVRKRTMDSAPTMPRERMTLEVTARITTVVIIVSVTSVTAKLEEYITQSRFSYKKGRFLYCLDCLVCFSFPNKYKWYLCYSI